MSKLLELARAAKSKTTMTVDELLDRIIQGAVMTPLLYNEDCEPEDDIGTRMIEWWRDSSNPGTAWFAVSDDDGTTEP